MLPPLETPWQHASACSKLLDGRSHGAMAVAQTDTATRHRATRHTSLSVTFGAQRMHASMHACMHAQEVMAVHRLNAHNRTSPTLATVVDAMLIYTTLPSQPPGLVGQPHRKGNAAAQHLTRCHSRLRCSSRHTQTHTHTSKQLARPAAALYKDLYLKMISKRCRDWLHKHASQPACLAVCCSAECNATACQRQPFALHLQRYSIQQVQLRSMLLERDRPSTGTRKTGACKQRHTLCCTEHLLPLHCHSRSFQS